MSSGSASAPEPSATPTPHTSPCMFTVEQFHQAPQSQDPKSDSSDVYIVRPIAIWESLERFKRVAIKPSPTDPPQTYQNHDTVLATRHDLPSSPLCTALILEIRAHRASSQAYVRLFWFYQPSQLPNPFHNQPHHASRELLASNAMAVIDADAIAGHAHVSHWREGEEADGALPAPGPFWRQTYDVQRQQLSPLPTFCPPPCSQPQNPDDPLIPCPLPHCTARMHKLCILSATLTRLRSKAETESEAAGQRSGKKDEKENKEKKKKNEKEKEKKKEKKKKKNAKKVPPPPLQAEWINEGSLQDGGSGGGGYRALITEGGGPHFWVEDVHCLGCGGVMKVGDG